MVFYIVEFQNCLVIPKNIDKTCVVSDLNMSLKEFSIQILHFAIAFLSFYVVWTVCLYIFVYLL